MERFSSIFQLHYYINYIVEHFDKNPHHFFIFTCSLKLDSSFDFLRHVHIRHVAVHELCACSLYETIRCRNAAVAGGREEEEGVQ